MLFHVEESQPAVNMSAKTRVYVMCDYSFICFNLNSIKDMFWSYLIRGQVFFEIGGMKV